MKEQNSSVLNMTEGNPVSLIIKFSIPMLIGNLFQQLYNLVDSIIVGQFVGPQALAAIGVTGSVTFLFFALCNGFGNGGGIITSQAFGKGDDDEVRISILFRFVFKTQELNVAGAVSTSQENRAALFVDFDFTVSS